MAQLPDLVAETVYRKTNLIEPLGKRPLGASQILCHRICQFPRIVRDLGNRKVRQAADEVEQRPILGIDPPCKFAIEAERDVPRTVARQVSGKNKQAQQGRIARSDRTIAQRPEFGMKCATARRRDFDNDTLQQRAKARVRSSPGVKVPGIGINDEPAGNPFRTFQQGEWMGQNIVAIFSREQSR